MTPGALPQIGDVVAGKYRIEKLLGRGGMGAVYEAHHELLEQRVALKVMLADLTASPQAVARFLNEARAAARIEGEHVARVLDLGQLESGAPYIALELLAGWDLSRILATRGHLPQTEAVGYVLEALVGLAQAHALGIVHRDLKPANIFVAQRRDGTQIVKVLDFGISKVTNALTGLSPNAHTATSSIMGTPNYVAPEQLQSAKHVDTRADIWSMGVILYELLSGHTPFQAETVAQLLVAILQQVPTPLRVVQPEAPPLLEQAVMRCLSQDPAARYQNVLEMAEAIAPYAPAGTRGSVERVRRALGPLAQPSTFVQPVAVSPTLEDGLMPASSAASAPLTRGQWTRSDTTQSPRGPSRAAFMASVAAGALVATVLGAAGMMMFRGKPASPASGGTTPVLSSAPSLQESPAAPVPTPEPETATDTPVDSTPPRPASVATPPTTTAQSGVPPRPSPRPGPTRPPAPLPVTTFPTSTPSCHIVTEYDADGQPHFKKVCN